MSLESRQPLDFRIARSGPGERPGRARSDAGRFVDRGNRRLFHPVPRACNGPGRLHVHAPTRLLEANSRAAAHLTFTKRLHGRYHAQPAEIACPLSMSEQARLFGEGPRRPRQGSLEPTSIPIDDPGIPATVAPV